MKYFKGKEDLFYKKPNNFNKSTTKEILQFALGANLYMNSMKNFYEKIVCGDFKELGTISICFEDATKDSEVECSENKVIDMLNNLDYYIANNKSKIEEIPLIFFRVRNYDQFIAFTNKLDSLHYKYISGFIFPKFNTKNAEAYLDYVKTLSYKYNEILYAMPILESEEIIYRESRLEELVELRNIVNKYKDIVLNIRVGGTDFSSKFGLRRSVDFDIYNVGVVSQCLTDILNIFLRENQNYVISAPVWEYFSTDINSKEVQGLINEIKRDKENGFCGKTIIHPSQINYVNSLYTVNYEEYIDAYNILQSAKDGGVFKGCGGNKMNEVRPHYNWAKKVINRSQIFGVLNKGIYQEMLFNNTKEIRNKEIKK